MNQNNQSFIKASIITVIVAGALGALSILASDTGEFTGKLFAVCLSLILFGIFATIGLVVSNKPEYKGLGTAGMIIPAAGFFMTFLIIIVEIEDQTLYQLTAALFIISLGLAQICLLFHFNLQNRYAVTARITAVIAISIFTLALVMRIFESLPGLLAFAYDQSVLKMVVTALIIDLAATLLVPLCNRLQVNEPIQLDFTEEQKTENPSSTTNTPPEV